MNGKGRKGRKERIEERVRALLRQIYLNLLKSTHWLCYNSYISKLTRSEVAKLKGVAVSTLRRWEAEGKLIPERTANGHRRYDLAQLLGIKPDNSITVGYARVSSHDQKADLDRQKQVLELFCATHGWQYQVMKGSRFWLKLQ